MKATKTEYILLEGWFWLFAMWWYISESKRRSRKWT